MRIRKSYSILVFALLLLVELTLEAKPQRKRNEDERGSRKKSRSRKVNQDDMEEPEPWQLNEGK